MGVESYKLHFTEDGDRPRHGSAVFRLTFEECPHTTSLEVVAHLRKGINETIKSQRRAICLDVYHDTSGDVATVLWKQTPIAITDGYTILTTDTAFVSKHLWGFGMRVHGHAKTFDVYDSNLEPLPNYPSKVNGQCEHPTIEDLAQSAGASLNDKIVSWRRRMC